MAINAFISCCVAKAGRSVAPTKSVEKGKEQSINQRGDTERWLPRHSAPFLSPRIRRWKVRFTHLHYVPNTKHHAHYTLRITRYA